MKYCFRCPHCNVEVMTPEYEGKPPGAYLCPTCTGCVRLQFDQENRFSVAAADSVETFRSCL